MEITEVFTTIIIPILSLLGIGTLFSLIWRRSFKKLEKRDEKREQEQKELTKMHYEQNERHIEEIFQEQIKPIQEEIKEIKTTIDNNQVTSDAKDKILSDGVLAGLRNDIIKFNDSCKAKGFVTKRDVSNFNDMLKAYHALGGNSYVKAVEEEFNSLERK